MPSLMRRIAVAASLAALSLPALAAESSCSVCGDPTFPQLENPAPAMTLRGDGSPSAVRSDPTFPQVAVLAPAAVLTPHASDAPDVDPVEGTPNLHVALVPQPSAVQPALQVAASHR